MHGLLVTVVLVATMLEYAPPDVGRDLDDLSRLSLVELVDRLDRAEAAKIRLDASGEFQGFDEPKLALHCEAILQKIIRREVSEAEKVLAERLHRRTSELKAAQTKLETIGAKKRLDVAEHMDVAENVRRLQPNLELLTALRRIQKKPDPVTVEVALPRDLKVSLRHLPTFVVSLKSADIEQIPVFLKLNSDYLLGRAARWRIELTDPEGRPLPIRPNTDSTERITGNVAEAMCVFGAIVITHLPLGDFVEIPKPGEYTVTVFYSNTFPIADITKREALNDLIIFRSKPFKLTVETAPAGLR